MSFCVSFCCPPSGVCCCQCLFADYCTALAALFCYSLSCAVGLTGCRVFLYVFACVHFFHQFLLAIYATVFIARIFLSSFLLLNCSCVFIGASFPVNCIAGCRFGVSGLVNACWLKHYYSLVRSPIYGSAQCSRGPDSDMFLFSAPSKVCRDSVFECCCGNF